MAMQGVLSTPTLFVPGTTVLGSPRTMTQQPPISLIVPGGTVNSQISFYNSSDTFPKYVISPYSNDNIFTAYDAYYNGSGWTSSSAGGAFCFNKNTGSLNLQFSSANQGSAITWANAMQVSKTTGMSSLQWVSGANTAKITFANVGYNGQNFQMPSEIFNGDSYMCTQVLTSGSATSTGAIAHNFSANFAKLNGLVMMTLSDSTAVSAISTGTITVPAIIPSGMRPSAQQYCSCVSNLDSLNYPTVVVVNTSGDLTILPADTTGTTWSVGHTWAFIRTTLTFAL